MSCEVGDVAEELDDAVLDIHWHGRFRRAQCMQVGELPSHCKSFSKVAELLERLTTTTQKLTSTRSTRFPREGSGSGR